MDTIRIHVLLKGDQYEYIKEKIWGEITGSIKDQGDLMDLLNKTVVSDKELDDKIQDLTDAVDNLSDKSYTKEEIDRKILEITNGEEITLDGYVTKEVFEGLQNSVVDNSQKIKALQDNNELFEELDVVGTKADGSTKTYKFLIKK